MSQFPGLWPLFQALGKEQFMDHQFTFYMPLELNLNGDELSDHEGSMTLQYFGD